MKEHPTTTDFRPIPTDDALVYLLTLVARRADQLRAALGRLPSRDLECWLQAEHEIIDGGLGDSLRFAR